MIRLVWEGSSHLIQAIYYAPHESELDPVLMVHYSRADGVQNETKLV